MASLTPPPSADAPPFVAGRAGARRAGRHRKPEDRLTQQRSSRAGAAIPRMLGFRSGMEATEEIGGIRGEEMDGV
jgi:hypothetical protein